MRSSSKNEEEEEEIEEEKKESMTTSHHRNRNQQYLNSCSTKQKQKQNSLHIKRLHPKLELNIIVGLKRLEQNLTREECHHYRKTAERVHF